ncbi:MAG: hypothetical protein AMXMBFR74_31200 [Parvibaculum sp.]|uniref:hypothetical protein n=1 Tax=Parvibaculum sp. TaxID=2024848 RepID=UPI0035BB3B90
MAHMMMKDIRRELLLALLRQYEDFTETDDPENPAINVIGVAKQARIEVPLRDIKLCLERFSQEGLVVEDEVSDWSDGEYYCYLTERGIEEAQALRQISSQENSNIVSPNGGVDDLMLDSTSSPQASTAPNSTTFGFAPGSAPFDQGNFADTRTAPASDRYVSVRDNQNSFDEILRSLTIIKNEFAKDHFKRTNFINTPAITAEIEAFEHQVHSGWVGRPAAQNFLETLRYIKDVCVEFKEICVAAAVAIAALTTIFGMLL